MRKTKTRVEIHRLLDRPWTVELRRNHDGTFFARVLELPGCMTEGATEHEALRNLRKALELAGDGDQARAEGGTVVWPNVADLCPDALIWNGPPPADNAGSQDLTAN